MNNMRLIVSSYPVKCSISQTTMTPTPNTAATFSTFRIFVITRAAQTATNTINKVLTE